MLNQNIFFSFASFFFFHSYQFTDYVLHTIGMVDKIKSQKTLSGNYGVRYLPETAVPGYLRYAGDHKDIRVSHFFQKVLLSIIL